MKRPSLIELKPKQAKSCDAVVEIIKGLLDTAFDEEIDFLDVTVKVEGKVRSVSISSHRLV